LASCHWVALDLPSESLCYCPASRPRACCILKAWHWNAGGCDMCGGYVLQGAMRFVAHMAALGSACTCKWSSMPPNMMQPPSALHSFIYTFPSAINQNKTRVPQALLCQRTSRRLTSHECLWAQQMQGRCMARRSASSMQLQRDMHTYAAHAARQCDGTGRLGEGTGRISRMLTQHVFHEC